MKQKQYFYHVISDIPKQAGEHILLDGDIEITEILKVINANTPE